MLFLKKLLFTIILFHIQTVNGQLKVTSLKYENKKDFNSFLFPRVVGDSYIAKKINTYLQTTILETTLIKSGTKTLFDEIRYIPMEDSVGQSGYTSMNYSILINSTDILSLQFDFETMGAYPEYHKGYYNFNSKTGQLITIKNILTETGLKKISMELIKIRSERINDWINEMDTTYNTRSDGEDSSFIAEKFAECNSSSDSANISIRQGSIVFYKEYCFPHVVRPYDTDLDIKFTYKYLLNYLTPFGKKILQSKQSK
jgi:hypothetical protein